MANKISENTKKKIQHIIRAYNNNIIGHMHAIDINHMTIYCSCVVFGKSDVLFYRTTAHGDRFICNVVATVGYEDIKEIILHGRRCVYE